jgi:hypothetical protein
MIKHEINMLRNCVLELFNYDPDTGFFTNRASRGRAKAGARAGAETGHGYRRIVIDYVKYYEHHLAWLIVHGDLPEGEMDHADGNRSNNAIGNLRLATRTQNNANNGCCATGVSGLRGVYRDLRRPHKWFSKIQVGGQQIYLGEYDSPEEARAAYLQAAYEHFGEFAHHRRGRNYPTMETR